MNEKIFEMAQEISKWIYENKHSHYEVRIGDNYVECLETDERVNIVHE